MDNGSDLRSGEVVAPEAPPSFDAQVYFIGRIRTPWAQRADCPRQGDPESGPVCRIEVHEPWRPGLSGLERHRHLQILYWMHGARRDLLLQSPRGDGNVRGTFSLRSPLRPNPIASSIVRLIGVEEGAVLVRGLDCVDGTPLIDIKPEVCDHAAGPKAGG